MPFHISTSTRAVAGSSTIYDDIKTPCLRSLWTVYGIKVMGCFIFAETLLAGSPVAPIPPSHTTPPLRRRLDIIQEQHCTSYYGFSLLQEFTYLCKVNILISRGIIDEYGCITLLQPIRNRKSHQTYDLRQAIGT